MKDMKDKKKIFLSIIGVLSVLLIAGGVTYSIFTYSKQGETENTITSGKLTFLYTENIGTGTGINITNAFPVSDELGKAYTSDDQVFDFKVESEIVGNTTIPYEVTVSKTETSTLPEEYVKLYLTDTTENDEEVLLIPTRYSNLPTSSTEEDEKQIYFETVEANENYLKKFRLRMWVADDTSQTEINEKTFTVKVNVYSNSDIIKQRINVLNVVAKDSNGIDLNATSVLLSGSEKQTLLNKLVSDGHIDNINKVNALVEINTDDFENTATTAIDVSSIANEGDKIVVFHYNKTTGEWEYIITADVTNKKTIVVDFDSFSPIGLITIKNNDFSGIKLDKCESGYVWNFDYTGSEQEFTVPCSGTYKLETWGAQGGSYNETYHGGYGGYSIGIINFNFSTKAYINIGGAGIFGTSTETVNGGYNGGGIATGSSDSRQGSGGGATHIALKSGILSTLSNNIDSILIVSGAGGGSQHWYNNPSTNYSYSVGGSGGGFIGGSAKTTYKLNSSTFAGESSGGTQISGGHNGGAKLSWGNYTSEIYAGFGQGAQYSSIGFNGGGGGLYGGGLGAETGGSGGSGYISNPNLIEKAMYCYDCTESNEESTKTINTTCTSLTPTENCAKQGNGYARITLVNIK